MEKKHVKGINRGDILIYTLSTCVWCKKTKRLLNDMGVEYYYIDVDLLQGEEKQKVVEEQRRWNPRGSYPTIVINDRNVITSYDKREIMEVLGDE